MSRFVDGDPVRSKVAITSAEDYSEAYRAVEEAFNLLGGADRICGPGRTVMVKPNMVFPRHPDLAETTHPAVVAAVVKILKKTGAVVKVGEQAAWHSNTAEAFDVTGIGLAALEAGADEVVDWSLDKRVRVPVPDPHSMEYVNLPASVAECDVLVHLPKMKTNYMSGNVTLTVKGLLGLLDNKDRYLYHRTVAEMGWATCDIAKAVASKHRLSLIDGIVGMEGGGPHAGLRVRSKVIVASEDMVAAEAVGCAVMGFHPLESPGVQMAMKSGLGTGELEEIEIVGKSIEETVCPYKRPLRRYVSKWKNVKEYIGGTCEGCSLALMRAPFVIDPAKTYALVAGTRVLMPKLDVDEVWLLGECACRESHQFKGFKEKYEHVKTVRKFSGCPGIAGFHDPSLQAMNAGTPYQIPDMIAIDGSTLCVLPDLVREAEREAAHARKEGRMTIEETKAQQDTQKRPPKGARTC